MKARKAISILLMITLLVTMNFTPGFAEESTSPMTTLTLDYNSDGGTVVASETSFEKDVLICDQTHEHDPEKCFITDYENLLCDEQHPHNDECPTEEVVVNCTHTSHTNDCCGHVHTDDCGRCDHRHKGLCKILGALLCGHFPVWEGWGIWDCPQNHCTHTVCDDACKTAGCKHTHDGEKTTVIVCTEKHHTDSCYGTKPNCDDPHHTDGCYDWPYATVTATANEGYYVKSMTGTDNTESIPAGAASYTSSQFKMDKDRTVTVVFEKIELTVTGKPNNPTMGSVSVSNDTVYYNGSTTLTAYANRGYRFVKWDDDNTDNPRTISNITTDKEYTAIFEALPEYTITTAVEGNGSGYVEVEVNGDYSDGPYYEGDSVEIRAYAHYGSYFVKWKENNVTSDAIYIPSLSGSITLTAVFEKYPGLDVRFNQSASNPGETNVWTITNPTDYNIYFGYLINDGENQCSLEPESIGPNETKTLTTYVEGNGDTLYYWYYDASDRFGDEGSVRATMYTWITADTTNGSIVDDTGKTLSQDPTYYFAGSTVTLTANPASGYRFVNGSWDIDPNDEYVQVSTSGSTATIVISDFTPPEEVALYSAGYPTWTDGIRVTADFELIPATPSTPSAPQTTYYTLNVGVEGPGKVNPTSGIYAAGSRVALTHQADEGAQFIGWFGINGSEVNSDNEILMNSNKSLIARFELIPDEGPEGEEFTDEETPQSGDVTEEEEEQVVLDQEVPYDGPTLPQTGGVPMELVIGAGFAFITAGISLRKKGKKEKE